MAICVCGSSEIFPTCDRDSCQDRSVQELEAVKEQLIKLGQPTDRSDLYILLAQETSE